VMEALKFCPRCGSLMMPRNMDGRVVWACPSCGYVEEDPSPSQGLSLLRQRIEHSEKDRIIVVDQSRKPNALPKTRAVCPRCGYGEAYYWVVQTRRADEPPTRFFKCVRCGYVWREYD